MKSLSTAVKLQFLAECGALFCRRCHIGFDLPDAFVDHYTEHLRKLGLQDEDYIRRDLQAEIEDRFAFYQNTLVLSRWELRQAVEQFIASIRMTIKPLMYAPDRILKLLRGKS